MASTASGLRPRVHEILNNPPIGDLIGRTIAFALLALIAANATASVLATDVDIARRAPAFFYWFEVISVIIFTIEYVARVWSSAADPRYGTGIRGRLRMMVSPLALLDLVSILPFYVELLSPGTLDLRFLRIMRLLRLFRLMRVRRLAEALSVLTRIVSSKRAELGVTLAFVVVAMLLAAGAMYAVEHGEPDTKFTSIPRAMWWAIVTVTTIGYGDMVPTSPLGQVIAGIVAFVGICAIALPVGILSSGFIDELNRKKAQAETVPSRSCPHCGGTVE
jgi:voltage-gated potassium channel